MIVQYGKTSVRRTCGSVRSSLLAPARLATVGSEAAETTYLRPWTRRLPRGSLPSCERQCGLRVRLKDKSNTSELPCGTVNSHEPKALTGSSQNGIRSVAPPMHWSTRTFRPSVWWAGTKSFMSRERDTVNLFFRRCEAGVVARHAVGSAGRGSWKKRRLSGNRTDRGCNITLPRKRAHFQQVVAYETADRTFIGGNRK